MGAQIDSEQFQMLSLMIDDRTRGLWLYQAALAHGLHGVAGEWIG